MLLLCMFACMHACMHGCIARMYAWMFVCTYDVCMYVCMYAPLRVCAYVLMHTCVCVSGDGLLICLLACAYIVRVRMHKNNLYISVDLSTHASISLPTCLNGHAYL